MNTRSNVLLGASVTGALLCIPVQAAGQAWEHTLTTYMVGSAISGTAGIGDLDATVDVSFGDIIDNFDGGIMLAYRGERGSWSFTSDFAYLGLKANQKDLGPLGRTGVDIEADQLLLTVNIGYALNERWSAYWGARYWDLDADLAVKVGDQVRRGGASASWTDPIAGLRYLAPLGGKWSLLVMGDIGGFGVGSDFSWTATASAAYQFRPNAHLLIGYRHIDVDYEDGTGADRFKWNVWEGGPTLGVAWQF